MTYALPLNAVDEVEALTLGGADDKLAAIEDDGFPFEEFCDVAELESCAGSGHFGTFRLPDQAASSIPTRDSFGVRQGSRPVRPPVVVEELVPGEPWGDVGNGGGSVVEAPELDAGGPVGALDAPPLGGPTSPLGPSRRQDAQANRRFVIAKLRFAQWDAHRLAGALEVGRHSWRMNLAAAVHLDGPDGEGHGLEHGFEEALGRKPAAFCRRWRGRGRGRP